MNKKFKVGLVGLLSFALMLSMSGVASAAITLGTDSVVAGAGGALTLTANAASTWKTTAGALTLTGAVASTWSTAAGDLTITTPASLVLASTETTVDAIRMNASAGGFDIDGVLASTFTVTGTDDAHDLSLVTSGVEFGDIMLTSGDDVAVLATDNITVTTTDGSYTLTTGGVDNGNVAINVGNDFTVAGAAGSIYTIGAATTTGTITIGGTAQEGALNVGVSTGALALNIGTGNGAKTLTVANGTGIDTIVIGGGGTAADNIDIGDALADVDITGASQIVAGTGDPLTLTANAASTWSTTAGDLTLSAAAASVNINANETAADQIKLSAAGTIAGNAINAVTTDGGIILTAAGAANGDITTSSADDTSITATDDLTLNGGSNGSIITIGGNIHGNTINIAADDTAADTIAIGSAKDAVTVRGVTVTIGNAADTTVSIADNNWSITAAGVGTLVSLTTPTIASATATALAIDSGTTGAINIGSDASAEAINIGSGAAVKTIGIGNGAAGNLINVGTDDTLADTIIIGSAKDNTDIVGDDVDITGASAIVAKAATALTITAHNASTWSTDLGALTISNIGTSDTDDIAITSTTAGDITVTAGNVLTLATTDGNVAITPGAVGNTITIGKTDGTGAITLGNSTGTQAINIGIGGTAAKTIIIGDGADTGTTTIKAGSGGIVLTGPVASSAPDTVTNVSAAVSVSTLVTYVNSSGAAFAPTIADGIAGQIKYLVMTVAGNAATVGNANLNGTSLVLDAIGEGATLVFDGTTSKWNVVGTTGTYTP